jgi:hypothetical protein
MGYATNPFNSEKGKKILKENFRLVFAASKKNPKDIESKSLSTITGHFVEHTEQIINNILKFSKGYRAILPADAFETGIYVCPHCLRRDWMNLWEFEYLGYYQPGSMANEALSFTKYTKGGGFKSSSGGTYPTLARVKCNTVYSCDSCHKTHKEKPGYCDNCREENFTKVGCGKSSYAEHFTRTLNINQLFANRQKDGQNSVDQRTHKTFANISNKGQVVKSVSVTPTAFEYSKNERGQSTQTTRPRNRWRYSRDWHQREAENIMNEIPSLNIAYSSSKLMVTNDLNCIAKPWVKQFPISTMQLLRWPAPTRYVCTADSHQIDYDGSSRDFKITKDLGTSYWCTSRDKYGKQHGIRYKRRYDNELHTMMPTITSPNPLPFHPDCQAAGKCVCHKRFGPCVFQPKKYAGVPIYKVTLEMRPREHRDESYQYSLYLPAKFSLQSFITDVSELPVETSGIELCPNDPQITEALEQVDCDELNAQGEFTPDTLLEKKTTVQDLIDAGDEDIVDIITKYANGIVKDEVSQITFEGSSERGVLMVNHYQGWVDYSSEVLNTAGDLVPRYLFINKKEKEGKEWLETFCKKLNTFPKGSYRFMSFGHRDRRVTSSADHILTDEFLSKRHLEERLIPVLAGTPCSISTSSGNESVFSTEFWRKLRGVKLKSDSGKTTFVPTVTTGNTCFLPTYLIRKVKLPICTLNGKVTKLVAGAQTKLIPTHEVISGIRTIDQSMMTVYTVMRCQTCNEIFDEGGVMNYRSARGWVNSGTALVNANPPYYTQKAFDTELVHELADYPPPPHGPGKEWEPFTTSSGFRVCPNWGIDDRSMVKYGKAMLKATYSTGGSVGLGKSMDVGARDSGKKRKK